MKVIDGCEITASLGSRAINTVAVAAPDVSQLQSVT